jgi:hypothetical protein
MRWLQSLLQLHQRTDQDDGSLDKNTTLPADIMAMMISEDEEQLQQSYAKAKPNPLSWWVR